MQHLVPPRPYGVPNFDRCLNQNYPKICQCFSIKILTIKMLHNNISILSDVHPDLYDIVYWLAIIVIMHAKIMDEQGEAEIRFNYLLLIS